MSTIPLYLRVKENHQHEIQPIFEVVSDKSISFNDKNYDFTKVFTDNDYTELIEVPNSDSACFIFMGPTGAGKTTTLRRVINSKIRALSEQKTVTFLSAFEVRDNKYIVDLLEKNNSGRKEFYSSISIESRLRKEKLSHEDASAIVSEVFKRRNTMKTSFNNESSRSCLVITFFYNNQRVTYIDLMGNEKFDRSLPSANVFANSSMSSITQLLSKRIINGRSSNLITNLIFKKDPTKSRKINIILNLDQYGDAALVKSTLNNIAELLKEFKFENSSSLKIKEGKSIPHYAIPTVASLSPKRSILSPSRKINSSPSKVKLVPALHRPTVAPKSLRDANELSLRSSPIKYVPRMPPSEISENLLSDFHEIQVSGLKKTINDLEYENNQLKNEHQEILDIFNKETSDYNADLTEIKEPERIDMITLKAELEALKESNSQKEALDIQKQAINDKIDDFKTDFFRFKEHHASFNSNVDDLKVKVYKFEEEVSRLRNSNEIKTSECAVLQTRLKDFENQNLNANNCLKELESENKELKIRISSDLETIKKLNQESSDLNHSKYELMQKIENMEQVQNDKEEASRKLLAAEIEKFNLQISERDSEISHLKDKIAESQELLINTSVDILERDELIKKLSGEISVKDSEIETFNKKIHQLEATISNNSNQGQDFKQMEDELENVKAQWKQGIILNDKKSEELKDIKEKLNNLESVNKKLEESSEIERKNHFKLIEKKNSKLNESAKQVQSSTETLELTQAENSKLLQQLENIKKDLEVSNVEISNLKLSSTNFEANNKLFDEEKKILNEKIQSIESLWSEKYDKLESCKDEEIRKLRKKLTKAPNPTPTQVEILNNGQIAKPKFSGSDIFEEDVEKENSSPMPDMSSSKKSKKILMPSNTIDSYKEKINSMSKEKKLKRKGSSHKMKNKLQKLNGSKIHT